MTLGYFLMGQDNDSYFLDLDNLHAPICRRCGFVLDLLNYFNPSFKLKKKVYDISYTYDGRCIVSLKFKEFCIREGYEGVSFKVFEREPNFFLFQTNKEINFDPKRSKTKFLKYCEVCGNYTEVVGFSPGYVHDIDTELEKGFYRTDLLFGSGNRKHPFIIVDRETQGKLKRERMKGIYLEPVYA